MAMGVFGVPALLAPALGPTLGGYLVTYAGWQTIFFINVPIGIVAIILSLILIREYRPEGHRSFDVVGFIFVSIGLIAVLYALSSASTDGWGSGTVLGFFTVGLLSLAVFVVVELTLARRGGQPLLDLRLFANGPFRAGVIANLFVVFSLFGGLFIFPIYLQNLRGLSAFQQLVALFVKREAYILAIQDAFRLTIFVIVIAIVATFFVSSTRRQARVPQQSATQPGSPPAADEAEEAGHFVAVEI